MLPPTHHPQHPLLPTLIEGGYPALPTEDLAQRAAAGFPPFAHLALLRAEVKHAEPPRAFLHAARAALRDSGLALDLSGPMPAPMPRRAGMHRAQLLLSAPARGTLHAALDAALPASHALPDARKVRWSLDVDPVDLY